MAERFPTGKSAHRRCAECSETYHVYQYRITAAGRAEVCLGCEGAAQAARLASIRP